MNPHQHPLRRKSKTHSWRHNFVFCISVLLISVAPALPAAEEENLLTGSDLLKTDILAVFAHPDDETGMATTLAHYAHIGNKRIANVYCTRGEGGGNMVGRQWGPSLGILRESELRLCLEQLGVERTYFLNQRDWAYTESARMTLEAWDRDAALADLVRIIRLTRPEILLTMNPTPNPGQHGHHQAAGILAIEAFDLAASGDAFNSQLVDEGLDTWQIRKLYISGAPEPFGATIASTGSMNDGRNIANIAGLALSNHRSQGFGRMAGAPWMARPRTYQLIKSAVGLAPSESDLFERIPENAPPASPSQVQSVSGQNDINTPLMRFSDRPAMERFYHWTTEREIDILNRYNEVNLSLPGGQSSTIHLHLPPLDSQELKSLDIQSPADWKIRPNVTGFNPSEGGRLPIRIYLPAGAAGSQDIQARLTRNDKSLLMAKATITPLPSFTIPALSSPLPMDGTLWTEGTKLEIPHTATWQGQSSGPLDASAKVTIAWDKKSLFVQTRVTDDTVVTNIHSNDLRGHWRSDSVEITIDPDNGAEHTLKTFKVGIFPFTIEGPPGAARDADANQGPITRTAPDMIIHSVRTTDGYLITTAIPWKYTDITPEPGRQCAFNVLIYDGDKPDAAPGENINKSRLAISPKNGVQGRPEDWARITLTE